MKRLPPGEERLVSPPHPPHSLPVSPSHSNSVVCVCACVCVRGGGGGGGGGGRGGGGDIQFESSSVPSIGAVAMLS